MNVHFKSSSYLFGLAVVGLCLPPATALGQKLEASASGLANVFGDPVISAEVSSTLCPNPVTCRCQFPLGVNPPCVTNDDCDIDGGNLCIHPLDGRCPCAPLVEVQTVFDDVDVLVGGSTSCNVPWSARRRRTSPCRPGREPANARKKRTPCDLSMVSPDLTRNDALVPRREVEKTGEAEQLDVSRR